MPLSWMDIWVGWSASKGNQNNRDKDFNVKEFGLVPLRAAVWGPFILLDLEREAFAQHQTDVVVGMEWLGSTSEILSTNRVDTSLIYLCRRKYTTECNWKVFCDNYLDGGYHVPFAHKDLASGLKLDSYSTTVYEKVSIQRCDGGEEQGQEDFDRLPSQSLNAFIYLKFMVNRYGHTNLVLPLGPRMVKLLWLKSLEDSEKFKTEDIVLCESVQGGLESPAYTSGRYAPMIEKAMHHFHSLLHQDLI